LGERQIAVRDFSVDAFASVAWRRQSIVLAAEDRRDLVWLADGAIGIEEPHAEPVERGAAIEDEVVAELGLGEEQPIMAAGVLSRGGGAERRKAGENSSPQVKKS
jgi:hypothetical protein